MIFINKKNKTITIGYTEFKKAFKYKIFNLIPFIKFIKMQSKDLLINSYERKST